MTDLAESSIRRTFAEYCHRIDGGRFDLLKELFVPEARLEVLGEVIEGRDAIVAWLEAASPPHRRGKHHCTNSVIDVDGEHAVARSDYLFVRYQGDALIVGSTGGYTDDLVLSGGMWLFVRRRIRCLMPPVR